MPPTLRAQRDFRTVRQCFLRSCRRPIGYDGEHRLWFHLGGDGHADPTWAGHMPDAMRIKDLNLGDRFRFFDGTGTVYGPVASAENDYTLSGTTVRLDGGASVDRHAWSCVEVTHSAPLCPCGRAFERCELDCPWPTDLVELSIRYG